MQGYETHITVTAAEHEALSNTLGEWAESNGLKFTHIVLPNGQFHSQPMLTYWRAGTLDDQLLHAEQIREDLGKLKIDVVRVKVEVGLGHAGVPKQPKDGCYFEHHVKVRICEHQPIDEVKRIASDFGGRLSRNARRKRADESTERFVTLRHYTETSDESLSRCQQLVAAITDASFEILEVENEYVEFDSNLQLDAGWLTQGEPDVV